MSGICGWFGRRPPSDPMGTLTRMAKALPQHGPIREQMATGDAFGLAICAHARTGAFAADGGLVAAIEGYPEWSDRQIAEMALDQGHAKALIFAYRNRGERLLEILRGTFALAILDPSAQTALLAIDRAGVATLCYAQPDPDLLVFGSTTDAVRACPQVSATITAQSIFDYLFFVDRIAAPSTIYREQRKLAPAERIRVASGKVSIAPYWEMPYRSTSDAEKTAATLELRERLNAAVKASLAGEDASEVGAFLSGGLDSSTVVGVASSLLHPQALKTFTIGFPVAGFDESYYAEIAAKHFNTAHQSYHLQPQDVVEILLKSVEIYDEPFGNSSLIPAYYCARIAREAGVEMMLAGDGGDEIFAGNKRYADDRVFDLYARLPATFRKSVLEAALRHFPAGKRIPGLGKVLRYADRARRSVPDRMADNVFHAVPTGEVLSSDMLGEIDLCAPLALAEAIYDQPRSASKVQRMMQLDLRITLADSDLRKVVRMCELAGVRTRFPFLNDDLVEFSARLPENLLMEGGKLRKFYKDAMVGFLPDAIINKQKHGFGLPYMAFMNSHPPLRELVCDSLAGLKGRRYFRANFLEDLIARARSGDLSGHETVAWDLVVLELWLSSRGYAA